MALHLLKSEESESPKTTFLLKNFLNYECDSYLKQPLTPPRAKSLLLIAFQIIDLSLIFAS